MTDNIINSLPSVFQQHICTLKKTSLDGTNNEYICDSVIRVINFDKIPNEYSKGKGWPCVPKSNDALYIDTSGKWYFIEFKNGSIEMRDIYRKIYDSLLMLIEMKIIPDINFCRTNIIYILVYNEKKYGNTTSSPNREAIFNHLFALSRQEERLFEVDKLEKYLLHETHTYTYDQFKDNFVRIKEREEMSKTNP